MVYLAAVGNEAGRLVVALVEVVLEPFRLVILTINSVMRIRRTCPNPVHLFKKPDPDLTLSY